MMHGPINIRFTNLFTIYMQTHFHIHFYPGLALLLDCNTGLFHCFLSSLLHMVK